MGCCGSKKDHKISDEREKKQEVVFTSIIQSDENKTIEKELGDESLGVNKSAEKDQIDNVDNGNKHDIVQSNNGISKDNENLESAVSDNIETKDDKETTDEERVVENGRSDETDDNARLKNETVEAEEEDKNDEKGDDDPSTTDVQLPPPKPSKTSRKDLIPDVSMFADVDQRADQAPKNVEESIEALGSYLTSDGKMSA